MKLVFPAANLVPKTQVDRLRSLHRLLNPLFTGIFVVSSGLYSPAGLRAQDDAATGFAVVELFTSQGCSSCPPADRNLSRIAEEARKSGQRIYTLSLHVDYWNGLGWKDPFSSQAISTRQREYAAVFQSPRVYTPQMIVNGTAEFVGSRQQDSAAAIRDALQQQSTATISVSAALVDDAVRVEWVATEPRADDIIVAALVQNSARRDVTAGENASRTLHHVNVVRNFRVVAAAANESSLSIGIPDNFDSDEFHVVAFIQVRRTAEITAADQCRISSQ